MSAAPATSLSSPPEDRTDCVAIVGAGPMGLVMARVLRERGVPYEQFEADTEVGGTWRHGTAETTHTNTPVALTQFPEWPMPADYPAFPSAAQVARYLADYATHFGLRAAIRFRTRVTAVRPRRDARWEIETGDGARRRYRAVVVANGHYWCPRWPDYPGRFAGEFIHSKDYKRPAQLAGRRVLVLGSGSSACDIAVEAAEHGAASQLSLRRGHWFIPKTLRGRAMVELMLHGWPMWIQRPYMRALLRFTVGDYRRYGLPRPDHAIFDVNPTLDTQILAEMQHGRVRPRPEVARWDGRRVHFVDGSSDEFDLVVCATGFRVAFPFFAEGLMPVRHNVPLLHGASVRPEWRHLYVLAATEARTGFGSLLSPYAELLGDLIAAQERMELPLGFVLKKLGLPAHRTPWVDPGNAQRAIRWARRLLPLVVAVERHRRSRWAAECAALPRPGLDELTAPPAQRASQTTPAPVAPPARVA